MNAGSRILVSLLLGVVIVTLATAGPVAVGQETRRSMWSDLSGAKHDPFTGPRENATVFIFIAHDCPLSNRYAPEINRIYTDYAHRGVKFFLVYSEPGLSRTDAKRHAAAYGYHLTALLDPTRSLARSAGATVTPEAAVFGSDDKRLYLGRLDNRAIDFTRERDNPTRHDLRLTLDAILLHRPVPASVTTAIGCYISTLKS